ncbi:MAG: hypothetical protein WA432_01720 [Candidatus Babeliaceae bacterium]
MKNRFLLLSLLLITCTALQISANIPFFGSKSTQLPKCAGVTKEECMKCCGEQKLTEQEMRQCLNDCGYQSALFDTRMGY